jgi:hypothetical protein
MVALRNDDMVRVPLENVVGKIRHVDVSIYDDVATVFFG